ncbi:MAG: YggS family pyridoxal phosphate-dependent enzyme [Ancrocorticia sp.]
MSEIPSVEEIAGRFARLQEQVRGAEAAAGRSQESVQIELAAKYQAPERVLAALQAGGTLLGHNIIQQLEASETALAAAAAPAHRTHVIGHVQNNKAAKALRYSQCIETVDSLKLATRLDRLRGEHIQPWGEQQPFDIMIQVNSSGAQSQYGRNPEQVLDLAGRIAKLPHLRIIGLMTIGAHTDETSEIARSFQIVRELRDELQASGIASATELSMGMTHDMDIAIAEGSTIVRVGTAVFGPRPQV